MSKAPRKPSIFTPAHHEPGQEYEPTGVSLENPVKPPELPEQDIAISNDPVTVDLSIAPIEIDQVPEKTSENVLENGWRVISVEQHDGKHYLVAAELSDLGVRAFWRKTRVLSHFKWVLHGKWTEALTRAEILPTPRFFKEV